MSDAPEKQNTDRKKPSGAALLIAGFALGILLCCAAAFSPPFDGDAYEYGEVALHWVQHGSMTERRLSTFTIPGQPVEHTAAQRANYYTVLLAPFTAVFGRTPWAVFIPGLLGVLAVPLLVFFAGRDLFGRRIAWWAALLCLFNPRLIYQLLNDPTPESLLAALCLASAWLFERRKYPASGAILGVAFFVKQSAGAFLPAYLIFALLFRRGEFAKARLWLGLAAFIALASPFLIRNQLLFKNPVYTGETAARARFNPQTLRDSNPMEALFERGGQTGGDFSAGSKQSFLVKTLSLSGMNLRDNILGAQDIDYFPGFFPLIFAACAPLFLAGLWFGRRDDTIRLFAICTACYLAFRILVAVHFETRHIFPVLPLGLIIAVYGAFALGRALPRFKPEAALLFALITGSLTMLPLMAIQTSGRTERIRSLEFISAARALRSISPKNATIMAWPPFASTFFSDRRTVPYVYGDLYKQVRVLKKYGVDYVIYDDLAMTGEPPLLDFLRPLAKGTYLSVFEVDKSAPGYRNPSKYSTIASYNPLEDTYRRMMDIPIRLDWPLETFLAKLLRGPAQAAIVFFLIFLLFHLLFTHKRKSLRVLSIIILVLICFGVRIGCFFTLDLSKLPGDIPPPVNTAQVRAIAGKSDSIKIIGDNRYISDDLIKKELETRFKKVDFTLYLEHVKDDSSVKTVFYPLNDRTKELTAAADVLNWRKTAGAQAAKETRRIESEARAAGFAATPAGGGLVLTRGPNAK